MEKNKIIKLLKKEIHILNASNLEISQLEEEKSQLNNLLIELKNIIDTPKEIISLNLEQLSRYTSRITQEVDEKIKFYKFIFQNSNELINIAEEQIIYIKNLISDIATDLELKIKEIDKKIEENKKTKEINEISDLITKIKGLDDSSYLSAEDIESLRRILDKYIGTDLSIEEYTEMLINITNASIENITESEISLINNNDEEEIEEIPEINNSEEDIINLLKKHNYDFNALNDENRKFFLKFGNIGNMDSILSILHENNIIINISNRGNQFTKLLNLSTPQIVNTIINNIKVDNNNEDFNLPQLFDDYLDEISIFIKGKRTYKKTGKGGPNNDKKYLSGGFEHYIKNREFLLSKGVTNINDVMKKCSSCMVIAHDTFESKFKAFELYNIPVATISSTLSCMKATEPLTMLDRFIEVGCFDYVLSNFSKVSAGNSIIYRIIKAKQEGLTNEDLYRRYERKVVLPTNMTVDKYNGYGINKTNGSIVIKQYYPNFSPKYNEMLDQEDNFGPLVLVYNNFFIKKLEEMCKEDEYRYNFNGVIISRFKVLRYYETMIQKSIAGTPDSVMYAICKNSFLTEEQYKTIKDSIDKIFNYRRTYRI